MDAMGLEHNTSYGHDIEFTAPNYGITTTPQTEWGIVVGGIPAPQGHMGHGRTIPSLARLFPRSRVEEEEPPEEPPSGGRSNRSGDLVLDKTKEDEESRLQRAIQLIKEGRLRECEVVAVVLYTGPMVGCPSLVRCALIG